MSNEIPLLTFAELDEISRQAQIDFCLGKSASYDGALARGVEQAVRAQWAAGVAQLRAEFGKALDDRDSWENQATARTNDAIRFAAERDAAQAEAARLKILLREYLDIRKEAASIDDVLPEQSIKAWARLAERQSTLEVCSRAALQPRSGEQT